MADRADTGLQRGTRAALLLAASGLVAFGLVALVHEGTRERIAATAHRQALARFDEVLAGHTYDNDLLADSITLQDPESAGEAARVIAHRARRSGTVVAVVMEIVAPNGYSGPIRLLVAIAPGGTVLAARVLQHKETPGLGDFIETRKSDWIARFTGRSPQSPAPAGWRPRPSRAAARRRSSPRETRAWPRARPARRPHRSSSGTRRDRRTRSPSAVRP